MRVRSTLSRCRSLSSWARLYSRAPTCGPFTTTGGGLPAAVLLPAPPTDCRWGKPPPLDTEDGAGLRACAGGWAGVGGGGAADEVGWVQAAVGAPVFVGVA